MIAAAKQPTITVSGPATDSQLWDFDRLVPDYRIFSIEANRLHENALPR
jgi:hypothetical protein